LDEARAGLAARIDAIDTRMTGLADGETQARTDRGAIRETVQGLSSQIAAVARRAETAAAVEQPSGAALAVLTALDMSVARGQPYQAGLDALKRLAPGEDLQFLADGAAQGLPLLDAVGGRLATALAAVPEPAPPTDEGLVARLAASARSLVKITPVDPAGDAAGASPRERVLARLARRDWPGALEATEALDAAAKQAVAGEIAALRARLAIDTGLEGLRSSLIGRAASVQQGSGRP